MSRTRAQPIKASSREHARNGHWAAFHAVTAAAAAALIVPA
ncbi:hypothetical protein [Afipia carboxidovorans]|nr:hypothetical protein [Afipia carboxidovorans]